MTLMPKKKQLFFHRISIKEVIRIHID